jgi:hypothetical protein
VRGGGAQAWMPYVLPAAPHPQGPIMRALPGRSMSRCTCNRVDSPPRVRDLQPHVKARAGGQCPPYDN